MPETNGSAVSRTCGAANSTTPSLHPTRPIAVPVTTCLALSPLVALAPDLVPHLGLKRLFQDQLRCQKHQVRTIRRRPQPTIHQGPKALACPLRCGYSLHRDAP